LFKIIKRIYDSTCVLHVDFMELSEHLIRTRRIPGKFEIVTSEVTNSNLPGIQHHCDYDLRKLLTG